MSQEWTSDIQPSIVEIEPASWDALQGSLYSRTSWLRMLDGRFASTCLYLRVWHRKTRRLAAAAVCYEFTETESRAHYDITQLLGESADDVAALRGMRPTLTAAAPALASPLRWDRNLSPAEQRAALQALITTLLLEANRRGMHSTNVLYVTDELLVHSVLTSAGFISTELEPNCILPVKWDSFDSYLASLNSKQRFDIRRNSRAFDRSGLVLDIRTGAEYGPELVMLAMQTRARHGMSSDPGPFLESARYLRDHMADDVIIFCALRSDAVVGFSLFQRHSSVLSGDRVGFDYAATAGTCAYFELTYNAAIKWAIANGFESIDYGTEAYEVKLRRGCHLRRNMAYVAPQDNLREQVARLASKRTAQMTAAWHRARDESHIEAIR